jgi:RNA polymerase sigma-70 factor (family 1)
MANEEKLLQRLMEGDESAFEQLFKEHYAKLCAFAQHIVKDRNAAEEIVADLFLYLWENCSNLTITTSLTPYLYRSVHNNCLKHIRHQAVEQKYLNNLGSSFINQDLYQPASHNYPIANLIQQELEEKIELAINALPQQCKEVFMLHRQEELTYPEIAEKLGVSVNTVKTQMCRALQKMRNALSEYLPLFFLIMLKM